MISSIGRAHHSGSDQRETEWIERFVSSIPAPIALFDRDLRYVATNSGWLNAFGVVDESLAGRNHAEIDRSGDGNLVELLRRALIGDAVEGGGTVLGSKGQSRRRFSVRPWRDGAGNVIGAFAAVQEYPAAAERDESRDELTGLADRSGFIEAIRDAVASGEAVQRGTAVFLLDIESFKHINELHGTSAGDGVLRTVANRLLAATRSRMIESHSHAPAGRDKGDVVARLGADQFGVFLATPAPSRSDAAGFARDLLRLTADPIAVAGTEIRLSANIGFLITGPEHGSEDEVLRCLDAAVLEAKTRGPNTAVQASQPASTATTVLQLTLLDELRRAFDENQFVIHYQPILRLSDRRIVGAEALLRWNHPSDGLRAPAAFLPMLEESGLIVAIGCWLLREVVRQLRIWRMLYGREIVDWVSVNVSARQFDDPSPLVATLAAIDGAGFSLERLKLEITESAVMRSPEVTRAVLTELKGLGIRLAIDDFGTGYSALGTLRHYAVDTIKIDREFVSRLHTEDGGELVLALLQIARAYGAEVIAEGIETASQRDTLQASGCGFGQGYLFAKPMDGSCFGAYALTHLARNNEVH